MYKSTCEIDVKWFPFDVQECIMKFGSWTYDGHEVDLRQVKRSSVACVTSAMSPEMNSTSLSMSALCYSSMASSTASWVAAPDSTSDSNPLPLSPIDSTLELESADNNQSVAMLEIGIDMSEFYPSVEWDILSVPSTYQTHHFFGVPAPYPDISFKVRMRRKTLFYTVNLIIPVVGNAFLTLLVFYLPSDSGEKVTLSISVLVSLTVFFLLLAEIIPPTSLAVPLLGKSTRRSYFICNQITFILTISIQSTCSFG